MLVHLIPQTHDADRGPSRCGRGPGAKRHYRAALSAREDKVYVDFLQNGHGRLLVSPLCVRPLPGAPVSMMLRWSEVTAKLDIARFTIKNAAQRLSRMKRNPLLGVLSEEPELGEALERLGRLVR